MVHRFRREIKILRKAQNRNVIGLHEDNLDSEERFPAFVMDLADCSLPQYIHALAQREGRTLRPLLTAREAGAILSDVMLGVSALHDHRDINPNNILRMPDGRWVIADFTLSKFLLGTSSTYVTATTTRGWGTMYYAAPEQWRDFKAVDHRCDIYALGAVIWDLFTSGFPPPHDPDLQVPPKIEAIVRKAMAREPSDRHSDVTQLREQLLAIVAPEASPADNGSHD